MTAAELAQRTGTHERYAREWLEQQAVTGILTVGRPRTGRPRRFDLPAGAGRGADRRDEPRLPRAAGPDGRGGRPAELPALLEAYRNGGGVSWDEFGADARESQADMNRPWFERARRRARRGRPSVHDVLRRAGRPRRRRRLRRRLVDRSRSPGRTPTAASTASTSTRRRSSWRGRTPRRRAWPTACASTSPTAHGLARRDAFDAAFAFECIHDMPQPGRRARAPSGGPSRPDGRWSSWTRRSAERLHRARRRPRTAHVRLQPPRLPARRHVATEPSAAPAPSCDRTRCARYARARPGFDAVEILPIEDFGFCRFYRRLRP